MIAKMAALMMGVTALATPVQQQSTDVVIRAGEYENKPGKRIYVDQNFDVPEGIQLRKDEDGYFISEWDINVKLATKLAGYLTAYGINTELQISKDKSEDLNSAGRIARGKNPKIYLSIHHNYFQNESTGYIYFVNPGDMQSYNCAKALSNSIKNNPGNLPEWDIREQETRYIGELNEEPGDINMLLEAGFFSNINELETIIDDEQVDFIAKETAKALVDIVEDYYKEEK